MADASIPEPSSESTPTVRISKTNLGRLLDTLDERTKRAERAEAELERVRDELSRRSHTSAASTQPGVNRDVRRFPRAV